MKLLRTYMYHKYLDLTLTDLCFYTPVPIDWFIIDLPAVHYTTQGDHGHDLKVQMRDAGSKWSFQAVHYTTHGDYGHDLKVQMSDAGSKWSFQNLLPRAWLWGIRQQFSTFKNIAAMPWSNFKPNSLYHWNIWGISMEICSLASLHVLVQNKT